MDDVEIEQYSPIYFIGCKEIFTKDIKIDFNASYNYVLLKRSKVIGFFSANEIGIDIELKGFLIKNDYRGKGYGSKLLNKFEEIAYQNQCRKIFLTSSSQLEFYFNRGYESKGAINHLEKKISFI